ncbi:hypothetical protein GCM10027562_12390 [Arthrobacter pigmenti]
MLFVHAHPDDESIATGATMAGYAAAGADVVLLTCTRGEMGEVIPAQLQHLQARQPGSVDDGEALADLRIAELGEAIAALGISRQVFLGEADAAAPALGPKRYRDSGMVWGESGRAEAGEHIDPRSLVAAALDETATHAAQLIGSFRPHAIITYDADGGYGHPDHIRAHEITHAAVDSAPGGWKVPWVYSIHSDWEGATPAGHRTMVRINGELERKHAAMQAHQTQIVIDDGQFALSNQIWQPLRGEEVFLLEDSSGVLAQSSAAAALGNDGGTPAKPKPPLWKGIAGAIVASLGATIFGTSLHGQILNFPSFAVPWGAVAALLLVFSLVVFVGVWARNVWMSVLTGLLTYVLVGLISTGSKLIVVGVASGAATNAVPPIVMAGMIWIYGITAATIAGTIICVRALKKARRS